MGESHLSALILTTRKRRSPLAELSDGLTYPQHPAVGKSAEAQRAAPYKKRKSSSRSAVAVSLRATAPRALLTVS